MQRKIKRRQHEMHVGNKKTNGVRNVMMSVRAPKQLNVKKKMHGRKI